MHVVETIKSPANTLRRIGRHTKISNMPDIKIAGIMRAGIFSPNHIGNDAAIFNIVAEQLRKRGCVVNVYSEEQFICGNVEEPVILNMCREARSIELLQQLEDQGRLVINSGYGIENCSRERMTRILLGSNIPYPESLIVNTDEAIKNTLRRKGMLQCWIKRGDYAMHKEDITYVRNPEEAQEVLQEYFLRGIKRAVINRNLEGELLKFYGVADTPFFHWFYPFDHSNAKNDTDSQHTPIDKNKLMEICRRAADILDVKIYGGDIIVSPDGEIRIIDLDDWPSFAPCRAEAATAIAKYVMAAIKHHYQNK